MSKSSDTDKARALAQLARATYEVLLAKLKLLKDEDKALSPGQLRDLAVVMGIQADKSLDFIVGRNEIDVSVDARSVHVGLPIGMTVDEARELADRLAPPQPPAIGPGAAERVG